MYGFHLLFVPAGSRSHIDRLGSIFKHLLETTRTILAFAFAFTVLAFQIVYHFWGIYYFRESFGVSLRRVDLVAVRQLLSFICRLETRLSCCQ